MWAKAWVLAHTEMRMVFKSKQVKSIPYMIVIMSVAISVVMSILMGTMSGGDREMFGFIMTLVMGVMINVLPMTLPIMIAADSIVGEKERKTLLPLLKTPLTDTELLVGKVLTALTPGLIVAYANLILIIGVVNGILLTTNPAFVWAWPTPMAIMQGLLIPPLFSLLGVWIMILISAKVSKVYEAYQTGSAIVMPAMLLVYSSLVPGLGTNGIIFWAGIACVCVIDYILFIVVRKSFNRDEILTRL